jgi:hypothetical protein
LKEKKMKKSIIAAGMLVSVVLLMAGGNVTPKLSPVADIPAKACKTNEVYGSMQRTIVVD